MAKSIMVIALVLAAILLAVEPLTAANGIAVNQQVAALGRLKFYADLGRAFAGQAKPDDAFPDMFAIKTDGMTGVPITGLFFKIALGGGQGLLFDNRTERLPKAFTFPPLSPSTCATLPTGLVTRHIGDRAGVACKPSF